MNRKKLSQRIVFVLFWVVVSTYFSAASSAQGNDSELRTSIILADIDDNPVKVIGVLQPLADYLAARLEPFGIESGEVMVAPDMETMIDWLADGTADILFDSPYPAMTMVNEAGAVPVLRRWKDGVAEYHSVFIAMAESGLQSLEDLQGQIVAFDAPQSTSGYMLPKAHLLELGLNPIERPRLTSRVDDNEIGYVFSEDDETTIQWIISGRVIAGVIDSEAFAQIPEESRQHMIVLGETVNVPRHLMLVRPGMEPTLVEAISDILIYMDEDESALEILDTLKTTRFDHFPGGAQAALDELQDMFDLVGE
jgi:phosphonate transport system substrate-binding protein